MSEPAAVPLLSDVPARQATPEDHPVWHVLAVAVVAVAVLFAALSWSSVARMDVQRDSAPSVALSGPVSAAPVSADISGAVCDTDVDCARYSLAHGADGVPLSDDAGEPYCLDGAYLVDTEVVDEGDHGVVCRPYMQV